MINQKVKIHMIIVSILVLFFSSIVYYNNVSQGTMNPELTQIETKPFGCC